MAKIGVVVLADMNESHQDLGYLVNALQVVKEAKEAGDEVELIFDGAGVVSAVTIANPDHDLHGLYTQLEDKVTGVCRYCSRAFHVYDEAEELGLTFLSEFNQHPSLRRLVVEGYEVLTF